MQDALTRALRAAAAALNLPLLELLLGFPAVLRPGEWRMPLAADAAAGVPAGCAALWCPGLLQELLMIAATAAAERTAGPLQQAWSAGETITDESASEDPRAAGGAPGCPPHASASGAAGARDCVTLSVHLRHPRGPPASASMLRVRALARAAAGTHGAAACAALESSPMHVYLKPCDEGCYVDARTFRVQETHRLRGGAGLVVSRALEFIGGTAEEAEWHCAAAMHIIDALVDATAPLKRAHGAASCPVLAGSCAAGCSAAVATGALQDAVADAAAADSAPARPSVDWDAVLLKLASLEAFPRMFKPVCWPPPLLCSCSCCNCTACRDQCALIITSVWTCLRPSGGGLLAVVSAPVAPRTVAEAR
jgi:hypothetical protein